MYQYAAFVCFVVNIFLGFGLLVRQKTNGYLII